MNHFEKIQKALPGAGLDAVLLTCRANRFYASGFDSTGSDGACLITPDEALYWTDSRYIEAAGEAVRGAKLGLTDQQHPYTMLFREAVEKYGIQKLGFDDAYITWTEHKTYAEALPCELVPASKLLYKLRGVKDEEELARMRDAQRIAEKVLEEIKNDIKPGVTERFIAAKMVFLLRCGGAEDVSFQPIVVSGARSSMPHGVPSDKQIEEGDFVTLDFGAKYCGYCSDMTRTLAVGHATDEMQKVYETVLKAQETGIAAFREGVPGKAVHEAAAAVIAEAGYGQYFGHGFGHGLGIEVHEQPSANLKNPDPLPAGAVISAEPGIYIPGKFGVRIEDVVVVGKDGCEDIMRAPKTLEIL